MEPTLIERELLDDYLFGSLAWCAVEWRGQDRILGQALECLRYLSTCSYGEDDAGFLHLPFFVVVDLMMLATHGERTPFASDSLSGEKRGLRLEYENALLGAILQDLSFGVARERMGLTSGTGGIEKAGTFRLVEMLLRRFAHYYPARFEIDTGVLRYVGEATVAEIGGGFFEAATARTLENGIDIASDLQEFCGALITQMVWVDLLGPEDIFELEHRKVLSHEGLRIGCRQINEVASRLQAAPLPIVRVREDAIDAYTDEHDESTYPRGGFSGLTTRGMFENLVRSELVYMESGKDLSLFDLRFVEGELLYYMRNEGIMRRRRRRLHVIIDAAPEFFTKTPEHEFPFSTLTGGLVTQLIRDCARIFEGDAFAAAFNLAIPAGATRRHTERVVEEARLLELVLREEIQKGVATVECIEAVDFEALQLERAMTHVVLVSLSPQTVKELSASLELVQAARRGLSVHVLEFGELDTVDGGLRLGLAGGAFGEVVEVRERLYGRVLGAS